MNRYLRAAAIAAGAIAFAVIPVLADNTAINEDTGNNSINIATATSTTTCKVKQTNGLLIENEIVVISNTGNNSTNVATANSTDKQKARQRNRAGVLNGVLRVSKTGKNKANGNTGNGTVGTGNASGNVDVTNGPLNTNTANVGP